MKALCPVAEWVVFKHGQTNACVYEYNIILIFFFFFFWPDIFLEMVKVILKDSCFIFHNMVEIVSVYLRGKPSAIFPPEIFPIEDTETMRSQRKSAKEHRAHSEQAGHFKCDCRGSTELPLILMDNFRYYTRAVFMKKKSFVKVTGYFGHIGS